MTTPQNPRWYCVNNMGMATLCADQADAEDVASTCDIDFPRQGPHRAVQLVEAPKIHYPMAEPVAWMWRVADSDWQLESTCPPARPLAIVEPLYTGYMADAYIGAREEVEIWKRRALEAEKKLQAESAVSARLVSELNAENGPTHMGEPAQQRQPLSYRQIAEATTKFRDVWSDKVIVIARSIEAAHGIGEQP